MASWLLQGTSQSHIASPVLDVVSSSAGSVKPKVAGELPGGCVLHRKCHLSGTYFPLNFSSAVSLSKCIFLRCNAHCLPFWTNRIHFSIIKVGEA